MTKLKALREECGKTRKEVAAALDVCVRAVARYEDGSRRLSIEQIPKLAELYGVAIDEIVMAAINSCP